MAVGERTLSEFLQHPNDVIPELARGPVVLRRRDADDLVVMTLEQSEALETALRAVASTVGEKTAAAEAALPWLAFLSARDQQVCLREIASAASAAVSTGRFDLLRDTIYAWQSTGLAAWDYRNRRGDPAYNEEAPVEVERPA